MKLSHLKSRHFYIFLAMILFVSCNGKKANIQESEVVSVLANVLDQSITAEMKINLDGKWYTTDTINWESSHAKETDKQIQFMLWNGTGPIQLNFNIAKIVKEKGAASYTIPEDNIERTMVDLNFFHLKREVENRMNKRIIFRKGIVEIKTITDHQLTFSFEGEGSGMREKDANFSIKGDVNVSY